VSSPRSRYVADAAPDYSHRFHAGNVGDVWKHCALIEILRRLAATTATVHYVETHAGEGLYPLGATGEWSEGIGRLWSVADLDDGAVAHYVSLCRRLATSTARLQRYPGSPLFARAVLGSEARLTLWERDGGAFARLAAHLGSASNTRLVEGDGLAALAAVGDDGGALLSTGRDRVGGLVSTTPDGAAAPSPTVVLVDPPWTQKADWIAIPDALARAAVAMPDACLVLWYPVKSLTRPNAMHARLAAAGMAATIAELITTPLTSRRSRLNGSGVLLVRPPAGSLEALAAAAPVIGRLCATGAGAWSLRMAAT
jgi:23S rRNA (adenine2030-N6)-methyltransferase